MSVRAKFKYIGYEAVASQRGLRNEDGSYKTDDQGRTLYEDIELRTLKFTPVYGNGDPNHENTKFWEASPSGELRLGTVNPAAWEQFEFGRDYYLDFTAAPKG